MGSLLYPGMAKATLLQWVMTSLALGSDAHLLQGALKGILVEVYFFFLPAPDVLYASPKPQLLGSRSLRIPAGQRGT